MRRIRKNDKTEEVKKLSSSFFDTKGKIIGAGIVAAVLFVIVVAVILMESNYGKIVVKNKTDLKLEYVKSSFINSEGLTLPIKDTGFLEAKKSYTADVASFNLMGSEANMEVKFKFENHDEMFTDAGIFNTSFDGDVKITFEKTKDPNKIKLKIKASNGVFQTNNVNCDETFTIDLSEGKILE